MRRFLLLILWGVSCLGCETPIAAEYAAEPFLKVGQIGEIKATRLSADGKLLVTGAMGDKTAKLWDAHSGVLLRTFGGHTRGVTAVAISADKKTIAAGGYDGVIHVFAAQSGRKLQTVKGRPYTTGLVLSSDGKTLYASFASDVTRQWDVESGAEARTFDGLSDGARDIQLTQDERFLFTSGSDKVIQWDLSTGEQRRSFVPLPEVGSIDITPDGARVVGGTKKRSAFLWDTDQSKQLQTYLGGASRVVISDDAQRLLTVLEPKVHQGREEAILWDVASGKELRRIRRDGCSISSADLSGDGKQLVAGFTDGVLVSYDAATGEELHRFAEKLGRPAAAARLQLAAQDSVLGMSAGNRVLFWDLKAGKPTNLLGGADEDVIDWKLSDDAKLLAIAAQDGCKVWNVKRKIVLSTAGSKEAPVTRVAFRNADRELVTASVDASAHVRDVETGKIVLTVLPRQPLYPQINSEDRRWSLAAGSRCLITTTKNLQGNPAQVRDLETGRVLHEFLANGFIRGHELSADDKKLAIGNDLNEAYLWNLETGELIQRFGKGERHASYVIALALSLDEKYLATGLFDGTAFLWDALTGNKLGEFRGHTADVLCVKFSADSRYLLTGSSDGSGRIWDRASGTELLALHALDAGEDWLVVHAGRLLRRFTTRHARAWSSATRHERNSTGRHRRQVVSHSWIARESLASGQISTGDTIAGKPLARCLQVRC